VVAVVPPIEELDLVGPLQVFATTNRLAASGQEAYECEVVTSRLDRRIDGESGLRMVAHHHYRVAPRSPDSLLVVCGVSARHCRDPHFLKWLEQRCGRTRRVGAVCVAAFLLASAGVLRSRRATVHWKYAGELKRCYPDLSVDPNPIWVRDGHIYTSAGIAAGIDLALAWVEQDHGSAVALAVARELVLFLRRPGGQDQCSVTLSAQAAETTAIHALQVWMTEHLDAPLTIEQLAARAAMSPRTLARAFARQLGVAPAKYLARLRVEAARRLLEQTDKGLEQIAGACGFGRADVMRRAFARALGTTPARYRQYFHRPEELRAHDRSPFPIEP
jgi:transcriptional regulator GlxA family with amidase domain